jgi:hypothetical protein
MMMTCESCLNEEGHYHIIVEKGKVRDVWYMSGDGYWDRALDPEEYAVEYTDDPKHPGGVRKIKGWSGKKRPVGNIHKPDGKPTSDDWLQPKVYQGKSMHEEELEHEA